MKETKKKKIDAFLHEINSLLSAIPETPETEVGSRGMEEVAARPLYGAGSAVAVQAEVFMDYLPQGLK